MWPQWIVISTISNSLGNARSLSLRKIEDDRISECTMDILNEATFNTSAYGAYDVNDDVTADVTRSDSAAGYTNHVRRGSLGSDSIRSESTQGKWSST